MGLILKLQNTNLLFGVGRTEVICLRRSSSTPWDSFIFNFNQHTWANLAGSKLIVFKCFLTDSIASWSDIYRGNDDHADWLLIFGGWKSITGLMAEYVTITTTNAFVPQWGIPPKSVISETFLNAASVLIINNHGWRTKKNLGSPNEFWRTQRGQKVF